MASPQPDPWGVTHAYPFCATNGWVLSLLPRVVEILVRKMEAVETHVTALTQKADAVFFVLARVLVDAEDGGRDAFGSALCDSLEDVCGRVAEKMRDPEKPLAEVLAELGAEMRERYTEEDGLSMKAIVFPGIKSVDGRKNPSWWAHLGKDASVYGAFVGHVMVLLGLMELARPLAAKTKACLAARLDPEVHTFIKRVWTKTQSSTLAEQFSRLVVSSKDPVWRSVCRAFARHHFSLLTPTRKRPLASQHQGGAARKRAKLLSGRATRATLTPLSPDEFSLQGTGVDVGADMLLASPLSSMPPLSLPSMSPLSSLPPLSLPLTLAPLSSYPSSSAPLSSPSPPYSPSYDDYDPYDSAYDSYDGSLGMDWKESFKDVDLY